MQHTNKQARVNSRKQDLKNIYIMIDGNIRIINQHLISSIMINLTNVPRVSLGCQLKLHDRYRFIANTWKTGRPRRLQKPRGTRPFVRCATYWNHRLKTSLETESFGTRSEERRVG